MTQLMRQIEDLINYTKNTLKLENYFLKEQHFYKHINVLNEISYTLSMEWFPKHLSDWDDPDLNPEGAAAIEIDIDTRKFNSIIFVGEKTFVKQPLLNNGSENGVIQWIEQVTGFSYDEQFKIKRTSENEFLFVATCDHIRVYPPASIEVKLDDSNKLIHYSVQGYFPELSRIKQEKYILTLEQVEEMALQQLKLINFPDDDNQSLHSIYAIEEIFITNIDSETIGYDPMTSEHQVVAVNKVIEWKTPLENTFVARNLTLSSEISVDEVLAVDRPKNLKQITNHEQKQSFHAVKDLLRQQYPDESEEWRLQLLYRENNYIVAVLRQLEDANLVFRRKLTVFIDQDTFEVINFIDNQMVLDMFKNYSQPGSPKVTQKEAYERLSNHLTLEPMYVFDPSTEKYILCGKLDCHYGIDAISGKVVHLDEL